MMFGRTVYLGGRLRILLNFFCKARNFRANQEALRRDDPGEDDDDDLTNVGQNDGTFLSNN